MGKSRPQQALAVATAMLLVASAVGVAPTASPVGTASATHNCSTLEQTVTFAFGTTGQVIDKTLRDGKCTESHRDEAIDELQNTSANQTKLDIYNAALSQKASSDASRAVFDNYLNDSQSVAWMKAEIAIAEAYRNGSSKSVAKSKAREAIADYYAVKQRNLLEQHKVSTESFNQTYHVAENVSEIDEDYFMMPPGIDQTYYDLDNYKMVNHTTTLVNGTEVTYKAGYAYYRYYDDSANNGGTARFYLYVNGTPRDWGSRLPNETRVGVQGPESYQDDVTIHDNEKYAKKWQRIQTLNNDLQAEVDPFVNETWTAYESGQINSSDVLSRNTQMFEYGVDATNDTSRNLYNVVAALSSMGLDTPSIAGAGTMEVSYQGTTYDGLVMAREAPNGSWTAGETYNTSDIPGVVMLATTEGSQINMEGQFTIEAINAEDGTTVKRVNATKTVYRTSNTSELLDKMQRISDLRAQVEAYETRLESGAGGDGGTDDTDDGFTLPDWLPGGWSGVVAAVLGGGGLVIGGVVLVGGVVLMLLIRIYTP